VISFSNYSWIVEYVQPPWLGFPVHVRMTPNTQHSKGSITVMEPEEFNNVAKNKIDLLSLVD
jgi:hypothetical protein